LVVGTDRERRVTGIRLTPLADAAARAPVEVQVSAGSETVDRVLPPDGVVLLRHAVKTRTVAVHVVRATVRTSTSSTTGQQEFLPVGIAELALLGPHEPAAHTPAHFTLACSDGLTMAVDGQRIHLRVTSPWQPALAGDALTAMPCATPNGGPTSSSASSLALGSGPHRVTLTSNDFTNPTSIEFSRVGQPVRPTPVALPVAKQSWSSTNRSVRVQTSVPALLVVHENANPGWRATYRGATLPAVTVDGWQQAWVVPAGARGVVHLRFAPQTAFTAGLVGGAAGAVLLVVLILPLPLPGWLRRRRRVPGALRTASPGTLARWVAILATLTLLGSVSGLIVGVGLAVVEVAAPGALRGRAGFWALGATLVATATVVTVSTAASRHPLAGSAGVQILCLVAIGIVILRCLLTRDRPPRARELTK
jgi:arabinofuranan 3-O-arabinosyltransferase